MIIKIGCLPTTKEEEIKRQIYDYIISLANNLLAKRAEVIFWGYMNEIYADKILIKREGCQECPEDKIREFMNKIREYLLSFYPDKEVILLV